MTTLHTVSFQKTVLASLIGLCLSQSAFALQEISDESLSETTGEGIAFLPENFSMVLQGAKDTATSTADLANRNLDTGYIRYIPVGPLSATTPATAGKADLYLYGLALSKGDGNLNNRMGNTIASWGTAENPWLFKVQTDNSVPNFSPTACSGASDASCQVTYLGLEAPRYDITRPATSALGLDAYNLKLALWADAFVRDPKQPELTLDTGATLAQVNASTQFNLNGANRANRLRLQAVWDGFSVNGSKIQVFQTLSGASTAASSLIKDTSYNNTLGIAGILRFNSGDTRATTSSGFKGTITTTGGTTAGQVTEVVDDYGNVSAGLWVNRYSPAATTVPAGTTTAQGTTNCSTPGGTAPFVCQYQIRSQTTRITGSANGTWTSPSLANNGVLRFSTRETGATQGKLDSPAVNGVNAPNFDATEGLYAYGANINLVLGTLYQPVMVNKDLTSNNLVLEVAAIPNKPELYKQIYSAYAGYTGSLTAPQIAEYKGSTCSVYACGSAASGYQGLNATHSSISIGSTQFANDANGIGLMTAYKGIDAVGVSFGALPTTSANPTKGQYFYYYALQNRERRRGDSSNWQYCTAGTTTCTTWTGNQGAGLEFNSQNAVWKTATSTSLYDPTRPQGGYTYNDSTNATPFTVPSTPYLRHGGAEWNAVTKQWVPIWNDTTKVWTPTGPDPLINYTNTTSKDVLESFSSANFTNLGSAVIDGMLIQHMKITTKGL